MKRRKAQRVAASSLHNGSRRLWVQQGGNTIISCATGQARRSRSQRHTQGGGAGFSPLAHDALASQTHEGQEQRQRRDSTQAVPPETNDTHETAEAFAAEPVGMQELEMIRDYGRAHEWPALALNGEEIIPAGRADWLDFVWLSHQHEQQRRVYEMIRNQSTLS